MTTVESTATAMTAARFIVDNQKLIDNLTDDIEVFFSKICAHTPCHVCTFSKYNETCELKKFLYLMSTMLENPNPKWRVEPK